MPPLVIRADAGGHLGTGHVMRMLALAQAWRRRGKEVIFITAECPQALIDRIATEGFTHRSIDCQKPGDLEDSSATIESATDWLILDGYHFKTDYQTRCREAGLKLLCVDDYGHCETWDCDILLNQNLGAVPDKNAPTTSLFGISYALLRQEFLDHPRTIKPWARIKKLLITLGGSDPPNCTGHILKLLTSIDCSDLEIRVIIGPSNPHRETLKSLNLPFEVQWRESITDMPAEYAWADGVISAGGSSCWEWLYFGLPGAVITIADNQEPVVRELKKEAVALCPGWPSEWTDLASLSRWIENPADMINREHVASMVDGRGADRVVATIDGTECLIRDTDPVLDRQFTFDLVNDPSVRSAGYATDEIPWDNHYEWLKRHHQSPDAFLFTLESTTQDPLGSLRFHRVDDCCEIGIALASKARGKGFADHGIRLGMTELTVLHGIHHFTATIRPTNIPSKNLFTRLGFHHESSEGERETWTFKTS